MLNNITITDITKTRKGFNALFSDDEFLFSVDDIILHRNNIQIGSCFTQQELACISKQSLDAKATDKAYSLLSTRMHSKKELYDKLVKKYDAENAEFAVAKMEELGLVNDAVFAQVKADYMLNVKSQSLAAVKRKLTSLGIDKDIINSVLLNFELDNQIDDITRLLQTKYMSKLSAPDKVVASLLRKGFRYGEIRRAFDNLNINLQEY